MEQKKAANRAEELLELQDSLDQYTFGRETMDVEKIKQIVSRLDEILEEDPQEFQKEDVWSRICVASPEILEDAGTEAAEPGKAEIAKFKKSAGRTGSGRRTVGRRRKFFRVASAAAGLMVILFAGVNIGTYATEKKNVFEVVEEKRNGTEFEVNRDVQMMEAECDEQIFHSWNEIPVEYRQLILVPYGMPDELQLYQLKIGESSTLSSFHAKYLGNDGKKKFDMQVLDYHGDDFAFQDLVVEKTEYVLLEEETVNGVEVKYYEGREEDYVAVFTNHAQWFVFTTHPSYEELQRIVSQTIENNF